MKKFISTAAFFAASTALASAAFVWQGGATISSDLWAAESSWSCTEGTMWTGTGTGPNTPGSNMWDAISISDASGSTSGLEGWMLDISLVNSVLTVEGLKKFQGGCSVSIDAASTLTINSFGNPSGNDGQTTTLTNYGTFNLAMSKNQGGEGFAVTLGSTGIVNVTSYDSSAHTVKVASLNATLAAGGTSSGTTADGNAIITRTLVSLGEQITLSDSATISLSTDIAGLTLTDVSSTASDLTNASVGDYILTQDANGISVSYVIPEPSAFGLLAGVGALALVAARRRRSRKA